MQIRFFSRPEYLSRQEAIDVLRSIPVIKNQIRLQQEKFRVYKANIESKRIEKPGHIHYDCTDSPSILLGKLEKDLKTFEDNPVLIHSKNPKGEDCYRFVSLAHKDREITLSELLQEQKPTSCPSP